MAMTDKSDGGLKALVADDHWIARAALANVLRGIRDDVQIFEANSFDEAMAQARTDPDLDIILIDLVMPGMGGVAGVQRLRDVAPSAPIVVVSVSEDRSDILQCVALGAMGYIPKTADREEIQKAINLVLAGEVTLPRRILEQPQKSVMQNGSAVDSASMIRVSEARLTQRQREIFELLSDGLSNADIASRLDLSINTVRVHIHGILQRLQLENRMQIVLHAAALRRQSGGALASL